jgi:hypothetical protein
MESSKALQEHFPTLLHNALEPWAATIQRNNHDALALQKQSAEDTMRYMEEQRSCENRSIQLQNRAAIDAVQNLQATLRAIGAAIEKIVMAEPVHKPTCQKEFLHAVSSYHEELRTLNQTVGRTPDSKLNGALSFHKKRDEEEYLKPGELERQLKLWYKPAGLYL